MVKTNVRTLKSGIEIVTEHDEDGKKYYTAVDPNGYIGRIEIAVSRNYREILLAVREYNVR